MLIPPRVFNVVGCAAKNENRYQLEGVCLSRDTKGKPHATATDGKVLMDVTWTEDDWKEFPSPSGSERTAEPVGAFREIIPTADCKDLAKWKCKNRGKPILSLVALDETDVNSTASFFATDLDTVKRTDSRTIQGTYPETESLIESKENPHTVVHVDLWRLKQLVDAMVKVTGITARSESKEALVTLTINEVNEPIVIRKKTLYQDTKGIILPIVVNKQNK